MKANKNYKELCSKTRDLIRSATKKLADYDEEHMTIKFNLDEELPLNCKKYIHKKFLKACIKMEKNN